MGYLILKYGRHLLTDLESLEERAWSFDIRRDDCIKSWKRGEKDDLGKER